MKRIALALVASTMWAAPALAQQGGGNSVGNMLENIGRSLSGDRSAPAYNGNPQSSYQQTYENSRQQYHNENDQQLQQDDQRLREAQNELRASSQALDEEMNRRGMRNGGNYSGSSQYVPQNYNSGPGYRYDNGRSQNAPYNGPSYGR